MRTKKSDRLSEKEILLRDRLDREICACRHARIVHGSAAMGLAIGHGWCFVTGCPCTKFAWHHEEERS